MPTDRVVFSLDWKVSLDYKLEHSDRKWNLYKEGLFCGLLLRMGTEHILLVRVCVSVSKIVHSMKHIKISLLLSFLKDFVQNYLQAMVFESLFRDEKQTDLTLKNSVLP